MTKPNEFSEMHAAFESWCERQDKEGWESAGLKEAAQRLLATLWACANNSSLPPAIVKILGDATTAFEQAKGTKASCDNGHHQEG